MLPRTWTDGLDYPLYFALFLGLVSTLHCLGMCAGIIGTLTMSLKPEIRSDRRLLLTYTLAYSLGRVSSYMLAGLLVGGVGRTLLETVFPDAGLGPLRLVAGVVVIAIGLHFTGWLPRFAQLERLGAPLWRRLDPLARRLLPVSSLGQAVLFGALWGWLPCMPVYSTLLLALSTAEPWRAGLFMLSFGLGTLPTVVAAGMLAGWMARLQRVPHINLIVGISLVLLGVVGLWSAASPMHHTEPGHSGH